ncbi:MAG: alpha/beta hydrolase [Pedobacter sp.]|uniref:alpha/beta fold hydrolase n=1 Tax=Pedobacter sp. TaxID=1411316 RepID=UPI0028073C46|nr:alpha/beta hydrolase [Pedobacter sp.]MDQ8004656.1 alpha/beta hydrolase [Pedobacter sp.]
MIIAKMNVLKLGCWSYLGFFLCFLTAALMCSLTSCTSTRSIKTPSGISEIKYLNINKTKQYVLIRGKNINNPILLFLHGGPGASATALLRKFNSELEDYFTVVYWDQRNAGKSYDKRTSREEIKVAKYQQDVDTLVSYLKVRFKVEKIFLVGHSWGSRLGLYAVQKNPENFIAYVGIGQELAAYEGELASYRYTLGRALETNNIKAIKELQGIGEPQSGDYSKMYKMGFWGIVKQKEWLLKLGGERYKKRNYLDWILAIWISREYSFFDLLKYGKASGFSAGNIIYDPDFNNFDFFKQIVPCFFISGAYDYNTPWELVEKYVNILKAPNKEFIKFERSGHSPVFEEPQRFNKEIIRLFNKSVEK